LFGLIAAKNPLAVSAVGHALNWFGVLALEERTGLGRAGVPELHRFVQAGRDKVFPVGAEDNAGDQVGMAQESLDRLSGACVPEPDGAVLACGGQALAVGAEGDAHHSAGMP